MDINKIKNYNQKVLAIFGTLGILLAGVLIMIAMSEFLRTIRYNRHKSNPEIISNEKAQQNFEKNVRTHQVSFENFRLIDSIKKVYLIPVSQSALKLEEYTNKKDRFSSQSPIGLSDYDSNSFFYDDQSFNNALIFDSRDGSIQKLFNSRISINRIKIENIDGKSYVLLAATDKDTYKDGVLDENDSKTLYLYSVDTKTLDEIKSENTDFVNYDIIADKKQLVIQYGLDKDKNGTHTWDEPLIMKVYSIEHHKLSDLIAPELVNELQNTLDGKK